MFNTTMNAIETILLLIGVPCALRVTWVQWRHDQYIVKFVETLDELTEEVKRLRARNEEWEAGEPSPTS